MNTLQICKDELTKHNALTPKTNSLIDQVSKAITFNISPHMKAVIAATQIATFAAQFRRNIELWDGVSVPINTISFIVSGSGKNKDSSVNAAKRCFRPGYNLIKEANNTQLREAAILAAAEAGESSPDLEAIYKPYMTPVTDIETMVTTGPGLIDHILSVYDMPLGAPIVSSSEFSDELAYNQDMLENIKLLSETFDLGTKQAKHTKGADFRSKSINGSSTNALFIGSPAFLLYDEATKRKFEIAFMSKLARRSFFCYSPEKLPEPDFNDIEKFFAYEEQLEATAEQARNSIAEFIIDVTRYGLSTAGQPISVSKEVERLFKTYKRYNNDLVESSPNSESTSALIRMHLQWKGLKLAGAFALMDKSSTIELKHYIEAIQFCELLDQDMPLFESHLNKADHERFADYIRTLVDSTGKASVNLHELKKRGFIKSTTQSKLHELALLAAGYDKSGIYNVSPDGGSIEYEPIITTTTISVSYKPIDCRTLNSAVASGNYDAIRQAKHDIALTTAYGYESADTTFDQLGQLLAGDYAYSPFKFRNGTRGKDNIVSPAKFLVFDIDDSNATAAETSFMLSDINHYVALSSDPSNEFKFRVLIELDSPIELSPVAWKHFYLGIAEDLALKVDPLPQSQIFFSYADRPVLSNLDASPLVTRDYIIRAREREAEKSLQSKQISPAQAKAQLADPETSFSYAYHSPVGQGSRNIYRAFQHARTLGADLDYCLNLIDEINEFWALDKGAMPHDRIEALREQCRRLF